MSDGQDQDFAGFSVAISGERILVGAYQHNPQGLTNAGAAYLFERQNGTWVEVAKLTAADKQVSDLFGSSVAIDGDTAVIGARQKSDVAFTAGAAYVFERIGGTWVQTQRLGSSVAVWGDFFGTVCSVNGDWIAAAAPGSDVAGPEAGAVHMYRRGANGWMTDAVLTAWDVQPGDVGYGAVSILGDRVAIGAPGYSVDFTSSGAIYVFDHALGTWSPTLKLTAPDPSFLGQLGASVSLMPERILAGAYTDAEGITGSGSAYLFAADGSGYSFSRKLRAPAPKANDFFGFAVADGGSTALVAAYKSDVGCAPSSPDCDAGAAWFYEAPVFARGHCFGEACPCGNDEPVRGCRNSTGKGAELIACGSSSVALDDLSLAATRLPPGEPVLLFQALGTLGGGSPAFLGDGLRCIGGGVQRLGVRNADGEGGASWGSGLAAGQWLPGNTLQFQAWYRDEPASPCNQGINATHALQVELEP